MLTIKESRVKSRMTGLNKTKMLLSITMNQHAIPEICSEIRSDQIKSRNKIKKSI